MWCLAIVLFFSKEVLGKRWGLSTSCGASPWVECDVVSSFSEILLKQQFAFSQLSIWSLHPIYHHIHYVIITRPLLFFQTHTNGHYGSCIIIEFEERRLSLLRERGKHDCIVGVMISLLIHQNSRRKTIFYNNLVQAWLDICLLLF
jgi:hypothetical protein